MSKERSPASPSQKRKREDDQFNKDSNKIRKLDENSSPNSAAEQNVPAISVSCQEGINQIISFVSQPQDQQQRQIGFYKQTENPANSKSEDLEIRKIELTPDQDEFVEKFFELLYDGFNKCRLISKGEVIEKTFADSNSFTLVQNAFIAGGLLPVIGSVCTGISIVSSAIQAGLKNFCETSIKNRAIKLGNFFANPHELYNVCNNVSNLLAFIYAEQIERLSSNGKVIFANFIAMQMFHYIATDGDKNNTYLAMLVNGALNVIQSNFEDLLRFISPSLSPIQDPKYIKLEWKLLNAIIFYKPNLKCSTKLDLKRTLSNNQVEFFIEGILRTGIKTQRDEVTRFYSHVDADCKKYGYRFLPDGYPEKLGYTESTIKNTMIISASSGPIYNSPISQNISSSSNNANSVTTTTTMQVEKRDQNEDDNCLMM